MTLLNGRTTSRLPEVSLQTYTPPIVHPEDYKRYYQGILTNKGHKRLNVYFFPQSSKNVIDGSWLKNFLLPQNYWQIVYDLEDKRFYELFSTPG